MNNASQTLVVPLMVGWACAAFVGCGRFTKPPQFVATMRTLEGGRVSVHPLFAFDINANGRCEVTYVDASGLATWTRIVNLILPTVNGVYGGIGAARNIELIMNGK